MSEASVRQLVSRMGLKLQRGTVFWNEFQGRAASSKKGRKRPHQAEVTKRLWREGKFKKPGYGSANPHWKERVNRICKFCRVEYEDVPSHRVKFCSEKCRQDFQRAGLQWKEVPHPRGMLGKPQSQKAKDAVSKSAKKMWRNMSEETRYEFSLRASKAARKSHTNRESASWKSGWREFGGIRKYYRSRWEANYGRYLEWLKQRGDILSWEHEPEVFWFEGIKRGHLSYLPDFRITEKDGSVVFHEVKGWMDAGSKTKIKRMAKYHPKVKLIIVDGVSYKDLAKKMSRLIEGWET